MTDCERLRELVVRYLKIRDEQCASCKECPDRETVFCCDEQVMLEELREEVE